MADMKTPINRSSRRGFSCVDAAVLVAGLALASTLVQPMLQTLRTDARLAGSRGNLRQLGKAHASHADANSGILAGFDWEGSSGPDRPEYDIGCGVIRQPLDNLEAAQYELSAILRKATGRCGSVPNRLIADLGRIPFYQYSHVPLIDWLDGDATSPAFVSPLDLNQQAFQGYTTRADYSLLPGGDSQFAGSGAWTSEATIVMQAYGSSYRSTANAWMPSRPDQNGQLALAPVQGGMLTAVYNPNALRPQSMASVAFPSNNAHLFEEYDYTAGLGNQGRYYADPEASVNTLAFDGSVRRLATVDANPGWDPQSVTDMQGTAQLQYRQIDRRYHPDYPGGAGTVTVFPGVYLWTRGGLEGIDFGAGEINTSDW